MNDRSPDGANENIRNDRGQLLMEFGHAKLVQNSGGKLELQGASRDEQTDAKEFISLFMHEAVVSFTE